MASCESFRPPALGESGNSSPAVQDVVATKSNNTETTHGLSSGCVLDVVGAVGAVNTDGSSTESVVNRIDNLMLRYSDISEADQLKLEESRNKIEGVDKFKLFQYYKKDIELDREIEEKLVREIEEKLAREIQEKLVREYNELDRNRKKKLVEQILFRGLAVVPHVLPQRDLSHHLTTRTAAAGTLFETGDVEAGELIIGNTIGVGWGEISPSNHDVRMVIDLPQTEDSPLHPSVNIGKPFDSVPGYDANLTYCKVIFFSSQVLGMAFESIYDETGVKLYAYGTVACFMTAACAVRLLATREGGKSTRHREQFAVYFRGASFLLVEGLLQSGLDQGYNVTVLKTLIRVADMVINWWVLGELRSYGKAFRKCLPF